MKTKPFAVTLESAGQYFVVNVYAKNKLEARKVAVKALNWISTVEDEEARNFYNLIPVPGSKDFQRN